MSRPDPRLIEFVATGVLPVGEIDDALLAGAQEHGLLGVVFDEVQAGRAEAAPEIRQRLAGDRLRTMAEVTRRMDALATVQRRLDGACRLGLAKGLAVSLRWYPSPWSRTGSDLDIYFDPVGTATIGDIVALIDPADTDVAVLNSMAAAGRNFEHGLVVEGTRFDVHRDIMNLILPTRQLDELWEQHSVEIDVREGQQVWTLDLELSLVLALLNTARDGFASLKQLLDVRLMIDAEPDWPEIERFIRAEGWSPIVSTALGVVCDVIGRENPLPPSRAWRWVHSRVSPRELDLQARDTKLHYGRRTAVISSMLDRRRGELLRALVRRFFPPRAVIDARYRGAQGSYLRALLGWRLHQRRTIRRQRA